MAAAGAPVPVVIPTADGAASVTVSAEGVPGPRPCTLLEWVPGRPLRRPPDERDAADLGRLAARLHDLASPAPALPDGVLDGRSLLLFAVPDRLGELEERFGELFETARDQAQDAVDHLWAGGRPARVHHGDLTWNNVVRARRGLAAIDCQDLTWGSLEQDLTATVYAVTAGGAAADLLRPFRQAYESTREWPHLPDDLWRDLLIARRLQMVNLALTVRSPGLDEYLARHAAALSA